MKMFKGLFVLGLMVAGLILSQVGRAQEAIIETQAFELYFSDRSGDYICALGDLTFSLKSPLVSHRYTV